MKSLVSIRDLSRKQILDLCYRASQHEGKKCHTLEDQIVMTLFFENSTRTKLSFETAALRVGAKLLQFDAENSSLHKGESFEDTIRMASSYSNILIIRHPQDGAAQRAMAVSSVPIINAGDGKNEHPSQTLLDIYTILKEKEKIDGLTFTFAGDLKHGRTVHSLLYALLHFDVKIILASPEILALPKEIKELIKNKIILETTDIRQTLDVDFLYMTRIQKERFEGSSDYTEDWIVSKDILTQYARKTLKILHPLPRVNEISTDVDDTPFACYFQQAQNGVPMRMAILEYVAGAFSC